MKRKSTSQSAFFNVRVLIATIFCLAGIALALFGIGAFSSAFAQRGANSNEDAPGTQTPDVVRMVGIFVAMLAIGAFSSAFAQRQGPKTKQDAPGTQTPDVVRMVGPVRLDRDLRDLPWVAPKAEHEEQPLYRHPRPTEPPQTSSGYGTSGLARVQSLLKNIWQPQPTMPGPLLTFEGHNNTCGCQPPDTDGDVGPNHYVEAINESIKIFDKDPASLTSVNLLRLLGGELGLKWRFAGPNRACEAAVSGSLSDTKAHLLIGDQAIRFRQKCSGDFQFWDLGEQWKKLVGLPFVYALWLIRPEFKDSETIASRLRALRDENLAELDKLIAEEKEFDPEFCSRYYREYLRFSFGEREKEGLRTFATLCAKHGFLSQRDVVLRVA